MTLRILQEFTSQNEQIWLKLGTLAESLLSTEKAISFYESALRISPYSENALTHIASCYTNQELYPQAAEYLQRIINLNPNHGESWGALGHCYLMLDDLQKAYSAYQQALYHLKDPKEPKLWYGIGILYDRYGSFEHAEEAFAAVIEMDPKFEKANEIYFRLGIIYKQQGKLAIAHDCFNYILGCPPSPLTKLDILFQIGHVFEQKKDYTSAKKTYESVITENPTHAKVLQQLGWLYQEKNADFCNMDTAISLLSKSLDADAKDAQTWYLLGRCYMSLKKYTEAYDAYQQAVYRDGRNPTFWWYLFFKINPSSIGVLYFQINQYSDALDAYGRAIRLNPYISEVWFDLGTLYESCNNQTTDAIDAYTRALELDPNNTQIKQRLQALRSGNTTESSSTPTTTMALPPATISLAPPPPSRMATTMLPLPSSTAPPLMMATPLPKTSMDVDPKPKPN